MNPFWKKSEIPPVKRSRYFPDTLYINRLVNIDKTVNLFIKQSAIRVESNLLVHSIDLITINGDNFELIKFSNRDRLLYDKTNDLFYYMKYNGNDSTEGIIQLDAVTLNSGGNQYSYSCCTDVMESDRNELYRIYNRSISDDTDEYLFSILDSTMVTSYWIAVILQPSMIG